MSSIIDDYKRSMRAARAMVRSSAKTAYMGTIAFFIGFLSMAQGVFLLLMVPALMVVAMPAIAVRRLVKESKND